MKMLEVFYIVRNKHTGEWLPIAKQRNSTSVKLSNTMPPRLFKRVSDAKNALNWWCDGVFYMNRGAYGDDDLLLFVRVPDRKKEGMEVAGVVLNVYALAK